MTQKLNVDYEAYYDSFRGFFIAYLMRPTRDCHVVPSTIGDRNNTSIYSTVDLWQGDILNWLFF